MKKLIAALILVLLVSTTLTPVSDEKRWQPENFKIMAYSSELPFDDPVESIRFDQLTHVIYAFAIPRADGTLLPLAKPERLKALVREAHRHGVQVSIALGGWSYDGVPLAPNFEALAAREESRRRLADEVMDLVNRYQLDGVELDWEYPTPATAAHYEALVLELNSRLAPRGKLLSAAVGGSVTSLQGTDFVNGVSTRCLNAFDWIIVMAYDLYGTQHAPLWYADTSVDFWASRGMPREKIILGLPLYARPSWKQYRHLVAEDRNNAWRDYAPGEPLESWYNGLGTLQEKTRLALLKAGGVMLFDIHEDTADATSALTRISLLKQRALESDPAALREEITCVMNTHAVSFGALSESGRPYISPENHLMLPVRRMADAMGAQLSFDPLTETLVITKGHYRLTASLRSSTVIVNGRPEEMNGPPQVVRDRAYLPGRLLMEALGYRLEWLNGSRTVLMDEMPKQPAAR